VKIKKPSPLVSVIIPAYNAGKYIGEAIDSVLSQTYKNIEVIIINDASTDNTLDVIKNYRGKDKRIRIFDNIKNMGIGMNRARGLELAKGEYICWQDADDISLPSRISHQVGFLIDHKDVGVVGGFIQFFNEKGDGVVRRYEQFDVALRSKIFRYNPVAQPASMSRAEVYRQVGTYNSDYVVCEDLEMLFRIGTKYKFANIQEIVLRYRQTNSSLTRSNLRRMEKAAISIRKLYSKNPEYNFTLIDWLYNMAQSISISLPVNLRMFIFRIIRGDK
jgi:glycosyltransferase involved in cell wall biosynthesis